MFINSLLIILLLSKKNVEWIIVSEILHRYKQDSERMVIFMAESTVSYWNKTASKSEYPRLEEGIEVDTLIIGGGITGITTAYCLAEKGQDAVVIEAGGLFDGTTGNTTGKITIQHDIIYSHIVKKYGRDFAQLYADSQTGALEFVRQVVRKESIDCQLAECSSYIFAMSEEERDSIEKEYKVAADIGIETEFLKFSAFPPNCYGMIGFKHQNAFHAVRYVEALAKAAVKKGAKIYCDTKAIKVEDGDIVTVRCENDITIKAKHLVMATQYPIFEGPNLYYTRLYADRDYGIAVEPKREWPADNYINPGKPTRSIRTHVENGQKILIIVGDSHFTARSEVNMEQHFINLGQYAEQIAGVKNVLAKWSAQDYKTPDQVAYIGRNTDHTNIFVATGYGKWGLSNGTLAGNMISDLIIKGNCRYEEIYSRKRGDLLSSAGTVLAEVFGSVGELIKSKLEGTESIEGLKQGEGRIIRFKGQKTGIYRDYDDSVTILDISCTHMTTELNFNDAEKTWDCPAHGGRFAFDGTLLEGPPKDCLKILFHGKLSDLTVRKQE